MTETQHSHEDLAADLSALADDLEIPPSTATDAAHRGGRQRIVTGLVAAGGLVVVLVLVALVTTGLLGEPDTAPVIRQPAPSASPADTTATPTVPPTPNADPSSAGAATLDAALAIADEWFAAYADHDLDAMVALLAPDAQLDGDRADLWMQVQAWKHAEGAVPTNVSCEAARAEPGEVLVECGYGDHEYLARVVGAPPVHNVYRLAIDEAGIQSADRIFNGPDYLAIQSPFELWMDEFHPDVDAEFHCCGWDSVEDARERGHTRHEWADDWAAFLDRTGCSYSSYSCQVERGSAAPTPGDPTTAS